MKYSSNSLSFVIFTYNSSDIIEKTLSCLFKSITFAKIDYEVILVDNNSNDNTLNLVNKFEKENKVRITKLNNPKQGLIYSRIKSANFISKDYVSFIDDDNFLREDFVSNLSNIITSLKPDVIGGRTICTSDSPFPKWWDKNKGYYACGSRFKNTGYINNPLSKFWGAGLTANAVYLKQALLKMEFYCTGRIGNKQLGGEDNEINYRMRLLGAKFYYSSKLVIYHYMRSERLNLAHLNKTREGNALSAINLDVYKFPLTKKNKYKLESIIILLCFGSVYLSIKHKINYFKYIFPRIKMLKINRKRQKEVIEVFSKSN